MDIEPLPNKAGVDNAVDNFPNKTRLSTVQGLPDAFVQFRGQTHPSLGPQGWTGPNCGQRKGISRLSTAGAARYYDDYLK